MPSQRDLLLITGIPGTGKTCYGDKLANKFGFVHHDLEEEKTRNRFFANPGQFIADAVGRTESVAVTWGFFPNEYQTALALQFRSAGFKLIWFDGNRPAALREFIKRGTVPEASFYLQMYRIEESKVIDIIKPVTIDPFDAQGEFKTTAELLQEMRQQ